MGNFCLMTPRKVFNVYKLFRSRKMCFCSSMTCASDCTYGQKNLYVSPDECDFCLSTNNSRFIFVKAFLRLDPSKTGSTKIDNVKKFFNARKHPKVLSG